MNILAFMQSPRMINFGGANRILINICNNLADNNHNITLMTNANANFLYDLNNNIKTVSLHLPASLNLLNSLKAIRRLRKYIKKNRDDAILVFSPLLFIIAIIASIATNVPVITSIRDDPYKLSSNILRKRVMQIFYPLAAGCVFQTSKAQGFFSEKLKLKSSIINNLINRQVFEIHQSMARKNIIGVGRLSLDKNWNIAIKAFSLIAHETHENFLIYGNGPELGSLKSCVNELGITDRVFFMGVSEEVEKIVVNAKLFVLSSDFEGTPNALIEALIMGVPCVSTKFTGGGAEMLIESNKNGILVPIGDYKEMANVMSRILNDKEYAEQLGNNAKIKARKEYEPICIFKQWESFIYSIVYKNSTI